MEQDQWTPATRHFVVACTSPKRYWDDLATRTEHGPNPERGGMRNAKARVDAPLNVMASAAGNGQPNPAGAPLLDYWVIDDNTEPWTPPEGRHDMENLFGEEPPPRRSKAHNRIRPGAEPRTDLPSQRRGGNWATLPQRNDADEPERYVAPNPPAPPMDTPRWFTGDVFDGLARIATGSIDLVVTSPPFLALRSYLPADHPDKAREIGSEATPAAFIDVMLAVTAELRRVLAPHGSIAIELGDTFSGGDTTYRPFQDAPQDEIAAGNHLVQYGNHPMGAIRNMNNKVQGAGPGWPLAKCKAMISELYRVALAYGINPLTGTASPAGKWRVRNVVTWCRPNPPVGALGDKWRPATSDITVACTSPKRYWDDLATRGPLKVTDSHHYAAHRLNEKHQQTDREDDHKRLGPYSHELSAGAPLLDYWVIPPRGYTGAHYAVYPPELVIPLIKAMCPQRVCVQCGEPSRRIVDITYERMSDGTPFDEMDGWRTGRGGIEQGLSNGKTPARSVNTTIGWTDCGHDNWRTGVTLDPFAGSGTTLVVAHGHSRDSIGIDLDARNKELTQERLGPFIDLQDLEESADVDD